MDMKYLVRSWASLCAVVLCLTACGSSDDDGAPVADVETVQLIISVPATSAGTRMGDPGTAVGEGADWDRLAVILAYSDNSKVRTTTITQEQFNALPAYNGNKNFKLLAIDAQPGKVYIYGVTYSNAAKIILLLIFQIVRLIQMCRLLQFLMLIQKIMAPLLITLSLSA